MALPYQDARMDKGHAFIVTIYANMICDVVKADKDVVLPAAILHDIWWSQLSEKDRMLIFNKDNPAEERYRMRLIHQEEWVKLADQILLNLSYDTSKIPNILEIISQHDTREGFLWPNDGAMRDADKLWRFDDYGFLNDNQISEISFEKHFKALKNHLENENFFYFESSRELARQNLEKLKKKYLD